MSIRKKLRAALLGLVLGSALVMGTPMHPDQIEELLSQLHRPKIVQTIRKEDEPAN